ncbi:AAA family ATPase [Janthinobacterium sp. 78]|uniref:AAA family ATPase n=1 Tax=Janthinobacterium sp. 78 TaxID=2135631 RepID=UPI000D5D502B|nr:AAA family ATPase [Janthinobacterium sp. 78]PVX38191.1 UvrD-like helicase family protein [Janthinobacterium sp. 78]
MIQGARSLPVQHLTIRVPWHDSGWKGSICQQCCANTSCTVLPRIATGRDDAFETLHAGKSIENFERAQLPPCVDEHGTFMAAFPLSMQKKHPYAESATTTHGHFTDTPYTIRPYSAAGIPFRWMLREKVEGNDKYGVSSLKDTLQIAYQAEREPDLTLNKGWEKDSKTWVQEGANQSIILDTFFSVAKPNESLVFFYAKRTPLVEDTRRVIVGVGRVKSVSAPIEYRYVGGPRPAGKISGYLWERNVEHSIRPQGRDGFLLPYQQLLLAAETDESIDLAACTAFAPNEYFGSYSYGTEHLAHDGAISSLLAIEKAIKAMRQHLADAPWNEYLEWIDAELNRLWRVRGAFPGLGAALNAFGFPHGNLLAWYLVSQGDDKFDPWPALTDVLKKPDSLPEYLRDGIGDAMRKKWDKLPQERRALLMLLARFNLTDAQTLRWYQPTEREKVNIAINDAAILANPYLVYEDDRLQTDPIAFEIVDRGLFPVESIRADFPLPEPSRVREAIDQRRVRAAMILTLEEAACNEGHTYLMANWVVQRIRDRALQPECPLDLDALSIMEDCPLLKIELIQDKDGVVAYQLDRYVKTSALIRTKISKRKTRKPKAGEHNWAMLVNTAIDATRDECVPKTKPGKRDLEARKEKSAALEVLYRSGVSVLMGAAGTGKSTLLKALCSIDSVKSGGILLLAPTGKARVRLEQTSGMAGQAKTVAQFLNGLERYEGKTGRYYVNDKADTSAVHATVIIDECSMLTEEQLAAVLDAVEKVDRLVLVGDPNQLPPIGAGRPYVDIVNYLKPANIESLHTRVASCFAELTVTMRQDAEDGVVRDDVLLAQAFSGRPLDAGADEIWHTVAMGQSNFVKLVRWNKPDQLHQLLLSELKTELKLKSISDEVTFECSLGGVYSEYDGGSTVFFNTQYGDRPGASKKAEAWQILSPVKQYQAGVTAINRALQQHFRKTFLNIASQTGWNKKIPSPAGSEGIIYGDKVINVVNSSRREIYPSKDDAYVANGDIGIVTGHRKTAAKKWKPYEIEVELASQPGFSYKYKPWEFDSQEGTPPLELAYALTVHKTQGSEFGTTFVVIPNPCRNLTREMLYTALTRQKNKVIILHQGDFKEMRHYSQEAASEINRRMTNLFAPSSPVEIKVRNKSVFLDEKLIYLTENGDLVRSKSEWIIADKLRAAGIKYQYEQPLMLDGIERFPDFTIRDDDSDTVWYWEHNGMLSNDEYKKRWQRKEAGYHRARILPPPLPQEGDEREGTLLVTEEHEGTGLDLNAIISNINLILRRV